MGRSVSTHIYAEATFYTHFDFDDCETSEEAWSYFMNDVRDILKEKYKSFDECDRWMHREEHIILESQVAEVSISEYCGLVAICLAPRDPDNALHLGWCGQVSKGFHDVLGKHFNGLRKIGSFSNGAGLFERVG